MPTEAQAACYRRHDGASRFAYNRVVELYIRAKQVKAADPSGRPDLWVPTTGLQCIDAFNKWKKVPASETTAAQDPSPPVDPVAQVEACLRRRTDEEKAADKQVAKTFRHPWMAELYPQVLEEGAKDAGAGLPRLRRHSRAVARKTKGSANQRKARRRQQRHHARIRRRREDVLRRLVSRLAKSHGCWVLETLATKALMRTRRRGLARCPGRCGLGLLRNPTDGQGGPARRSHHPGTAELPQHPAVQPTFDSAKGTERRGFEPRVRVNAQ